MLLFKGGSQTENLLGYIELDSHRLSPCLPTAVLEISPPAHLEGPYTTQPLLARLTTPAAWFTAVTSAFPATTRQAPLSTVTATRPALNLLVASHLACHPAPARHPATT